MLNKITLAAMYAACINCRSGVVCSRNTLRLLLISGTNLSDRIAVFKRLYEMLIDLSVGVSSTEISPCLLRCPQ